MSLCTSHDRAVGPSDDCNILGIIRGDVTACLFLDQNILREDLKLKEEIFTITTTTTIFIVRTRS